VNPEDMEDELQSASRPLANTLDELKALYANPPGEVFDGLDELCGQGNVRVHATGARRSNDADDVRYDLISPIALERVAQTYDKGAKKYGEHNWLRGFPISDLLNHAIRHQYLYLSGDRSEDHLAHAAWGLFAAIHSEVAWPHLNWQLLREGCVPSDFDPHEGPLF
jgi:Domain of unknown function (DUF5664)